MVRLEVGVDSLGLFLDPIWVVRVLGKVISSLVSFLLLSDIGQELSLLLDNLEALTLPLVIDLVILTSILLLVHTLLLDIEVLDDLLVVLDG